VAEPHTAPRRLKPRPLRIKSFRSRQVTAIDVDGQTLCVVQAVHRGGQTSVTRLGTIQLEVPVDPGRSEPQVMGETIARALKQLHVKPSAVVMGIPRALVVLRTLSVPATDDIREMASMVHFQVAKDLPFKLEDAVVDFKVQEESAPAPAPESKDKAESPEGTGHAPKVEVMVAAVKREVVERYRQALSAAGLNLLSLGLRSYANARCIEACQIASPEEAVALVSLRPDEVIIDVILGRSLLFSRVAAVKIHSAPADGAASLEGGVPAKPAKQSGFVDAVVIEVVRTLHSYSGMERQSRVTKVAVAGDTGEESDVVAALGKRVSVPCVSLNPAHTLGLKTGDEKLSGATAAMGLGLGLNDPEGLPFDFLKPKRPAVRRDWRRIKMFAGAALAVFVLVTLLGVRSHLTQQRQAVLQELQEQIAGEEQNRPAFRRMQLHSRGVQEWMRERRNWLDHYAYLSAVLPPSTDIYVTAFSTSADGTIRLGIQARSGEILARMDRDLRTAGYELKPLAITPSSDRHGYPFKSNVELRFSNRLEIDLNQLQPPPRPEDDASLDGAVPTAQSTTSSEAPALRAQTRRRPAP
jgi:type IV pilus assembly protein PilM